MRIGDEEMKALVLFSGGVDSTTALALAIDKYGSEQVLALSIGYGQKHTRELESAKKIADYYSVRLRSLDLAGIFEGSDCSLLSSSTEEVPKESYKDQLDKREGKPVSTYVPFRNGLFISCAAAISLSNGCTEIWYGAHSDDAAGNAYPDCSSEFNDSIGRAVYVGSGEQLRIVAPFIGMTKAQVVAEGLKIGVPYEMTWSCYEGGDKPCGLCGTCRDRLNAFRANGIEDPAFREED